MNIYVSCFKQSLWVHKQSTHQKLVFFFLDSNRLPEYTNIVPIKNEGIISWFMQTFVNISIVPIIFLQLT